MSMCEGLIKVSFFRISVVQAHVYFQNDYLPTAAAYVSISKVVLLPCLFCQLSLIPSSRMASLLVWSLI
uniref:Uncharacterized protein n=1 Tax=Arundo donax TaxID=35708 RepID=A0A0A8Y553_ARUDO